MSKREMKDLVKALIEAGWRVEDTKDGWVVKHPTETDSRLYPPIHLHKTTSDHRAWRNARSLLRKQGFDWPPTK